LTPDRGGLIAFAHNIAFPAAAIAGAILAVKNRRLVAGLLVSLPTLFNWIGAAIFTMAVLRYGF
jgi:hypothetical protein